MTIQEIRDEVVIIFIAGHETTAVAMTFIWYLLSKHPWVEAKLHQELAGTPQVGDSSKRLLRDVLGDIERLLGTAPAAATASAATDAAAPAEPTSRLEALAVEFEAEHPSLSASLREFVDLLGRAGL